MKKDDRDCLIFLATLGAIILAGGTGAAILCYRNRQSLQDAAIGFVMGSCVTAFAEYLAFTIHE